jgi:hypothetical protein
MVEQWVYEQPDFAAQLKAISRQKTGLRASLRQGVKLDLMYEGDERSAWMIYYALLDAEGKLLPQGDVCKGEVRAYFRVLDPELRITVHKQRIQLGVKFYVVIGSNKVAEGVVTEVLYLADKN